MRHPRVADWLAWQQVAHPFAIDMGLERVGEVWRRLGSPRAPTVLTVGGTNGKGSVAAGLDADLVVLNRELAVDTVIARGRVMVRGGEPLVKGPFEG